MNSTPQRSLPQTGQLNLINPQTTTILWLIRHAEVEPRYQSVFGGRIDMDLSARGHEQAAALADYLRHRNFAAAYASPMLRVQQTLQPWLKRDGLQPVIREDLREVDFGDWTGLTWAEIPQKFGVSAFSWLDQLEASTMANAESVSSLRARVERCVREILSTHAGKEVAIFCHGGVIRVILALLLGWPLTQFGTVEIEYASLTQVACTPPTAKLQLLNFTPWRELNVRAAAPVQGLPAPGAAALRAS